MDVKLPEMLEAPVMQGEEVGRLVFKTDAETVLAECPIIAENGVNKKDVKTTAKMLIKYWINPLKSDILKHNA